MYTFYSYFFSLLLGIRINYVVDICLKNLSTVVSDKCDDGLEQII